MSRQFSNISSSDDETPALSENPVKPTKTERRYKRILWQGKIGPAFWTFTGLVSLTVNVILVIILIILAKELFTLKSVVSNQLIGGLYGNFVKMDQAVINTTISVQDTILVNDTIPVQFLLPLEQKTEVILTKNTPINNASVTIITPFFTLNEAPTDIILPAGTILPVELNIDVPVDTTIPVVLNVPVNLSVPVDIPLQNTQLHEPFVGLQEVVLPYRQLLSDTPNSWDEAVCSTPGILCSLLTEEE